MGKHSKKSLFFLMVVTIMVTGLGVAVNKAESQSESTVGCAHCDVFSSRSNALYIRSFDGQTFGSVELAPIGLDVEPGLVGGVFRGWSWNGSIASYVIIDGSKQNILIVRPFDGQTFGSVSSTQTVSSADRFRGWSWDGSTASYVAADGSGRSTLYIRPFNGQTFGSVTSTQTVSDRDVFRGWSWNGGTASYIVE